MGLIAWLQQQGQWRRDHIAAFSVATQLETDGLTRLQHDTLSAVAHIIAPKQFKRVAMDKGVGTYLVAPLGSSGAELYIYPNEAEIFGRKPHAWFEEWDYRTPEDLVAAVVRECLARFV
jgi:hypothetical protein